MRGARRGSLVLAVLAGCGAAEGLAVIAPTLPDDVVRVGVVLLDEDGRAMASTPLGFGAPIVELPLPATAAPIGAALLIGYREDELGDVSEDAGRLPLRIDGGAPLPRPSFFGRGHAEGRVVSIHEAPLDHAIGIGEASSSCAAWRSDAVRLAGPLVGLSSDGATALAFTSDRAGTSIFRVGPGRAERLDDSIPGFARVHATPMSAAARLADGRVWMVSHQGELFGGTLEDGLVHVPLAGDRLPTFSPPPADHPNDSPRSGAFTISSSVADGSAIVVGGSGGVWRVRLRARRADRIVDREAAGCRAGEGAVVFHEGALYTLAGSLLCTDVVRYEGGEVTTDRFPTSPGEGLENLSALGATPHGVLVAKSQIGSTRVFRRVADGDWRPFPSGDGRLTNQAPKFFAAFGGEVFITGDYGHLRSLERPECDDVIGVAHVGFFAPIEGGFVAGNARQELYAPSTTWVPGLVAIATR